MKKRYEIRVRDEFNTVVLTVNGPVDMELVRSWTIEGRTTALQSGYNMLVDLRQAEIPSSYGEAYYHPRDPEIFKSEIRKVRVAILLPEDHDRAFWNFYQTSCRNACLNVSIFTNERRAYEHLLPLQVRR